MKTKDHLALGRFLLDTTGCEGLHRHRRAFLLGCVEPDYNMVTYTRGMSGHKKFRGHNAENSLKHIEKFMAKFQADGLRSAWDYFLLGTVLHYVADSFTWPHNDFWGKSLVEHAVYEAKLHELFTCALNAENARDDRVGAGSLQSYFEGCHAEYRDARRDMNTDCEYIVKVCKTMLSGCLCYAKVSAERGIVMKKVDFYEGTYHHGLV